MIKLLSCFALLFSISFAQDSTVTLKVSDLEKLAPGAVAEIKNMAAMDAAEKSIEKRIGRYGKWVGLGKEVGIAVNGCLEAINAELVKLSETKLGKRAIFLVTWKVLYSDVLGLFIGIPSLIVWTILFVWVMKRCFIARVVVTINSDGTKEETIVNDDWDTEKWTALAISAIIYVVVVFCIMGFIIF